MVTLLITSLAIIFLVGIAIYFWARPVAQTSVQGLPPNSDLRGLFEESAMSRRVQDQLNEAATLDTKRELLERARHGDRTALNDSQSIGDADLYNHILTELVQQADTGSKLLSLASHVSQNDLPVNEVLAKAIISSWKNAPNRNNTAKALHFAALNDDATLYREAVEDALQIWRDGKLADVSVSELRSLFDGEFWILSSRSRSSGAGFVLKQTLADARRELEAAVSATQ